MHHIWLSKCFCKKYDIWIFGVDGVYEILPKMNGLCVWIINTKCFDILRDPILYNAKDLLKKPLVVIIKINRVDILILFRRIFCVCDSSIRALCKKFFMCFHPRMIGGALQGKIERNLYIQFLCCGNKFLKILKSSQFWVYCIVATIGTADTPWNPAISRLCGRGIIFSFSKRDADGMNWRKI